MLKLFLPEVVRLWKPSNIIPTRLSYIILPKATVDKSGLVLRPAIVDFMVRVEPVACQPSTNRPESFGFFIFATTLNPPPPLLI